MHTPLQVPKVEHETQRLAVLDLDWERIAAVDIVAVLASFLGRGQAISRVTVYPSDYGLERMAEEAVRGPQVRLHLFLPASSVRFKPHFVTVDLGRS